MRKILFLFVLVGLVAPAVSQARSTLTASDLQFLGAFAAPWHTAGADTAYGRGLAVRRVNGQPRLLSTGYNGAGRYPLYEMTVPTLKTSAPWNEAPVVAQWGDVFAHQHGYINGLYWDQTDQRLYYSSSWSYVASGSEPTLAFATLNDSNGTAQSYGRWGFASRSSKMANYGVVPVPADFQAEFGTGRLASGFGGYQSMMSFGPVSMGPSLTAFSPPSVGTEGTDLVNKPLVGYPLSDWTTGPRPTVDRCWRPDTILSDANECTDPDNSFAGSNNSPTDAEHILTGDEIFGWQGYSKDANSRLAYANHVPVTIRTKHWIQGMAFWTSGDTVGQAGAWIQTANKEGLILLADLGVDRVKYLNSNVVTDAHTHEWLIYSRSQLGQVAAGSVAQDQIQPAQYTAQFAGLPTTITRFPSQMNEPPFPGSVTGMAYDPIDAKLYVALSMVSNYPTYDGGSGTVIYVYQVNDSPSPPPTGTTRSLNGRLSGRLH